MITRLLVAPAISGRLGGGKPIAIGSVVTISSDMVQNQLDAGLQRGNGMSGIDASQTTRHADGVIETLQKLSSTGPDRLVAQYCFFGPRPRWSAVCIDNAPMQSATPNKGGLRSFGELTLHQLPRASSFRDAPLRGLLRMRFIACCTKRLNHTPLLHGEEPARSAGVSNHGASDCARLILRDGPQ